VGVRHELRDQFIATHYGKPPWSPQEFVRTVRTINHYDVVSFAIFSDKFPDKHPHEWTKGGLITLEEATEAYIVEVIAVSHC